MISVDAVRAAHLRAAPWPYAELDVAALRAGGWRPAPIRELVLKVFQRCNLACDYCYVYELADRSWQDRPATMSPEVWQAALARLAEHIRRHGLTAVRVVLHGGEPLLFGADRLAELAGAIHAAMPSGCRAEISLQTNGVRLDDAMIEVLRANRIRAGVSVDGIAADHDRHRRTPSGQGSFASAAAALRRLRSTPCAYAGILCTVAPDTDPIATYEQLLEFAPPMLDFLLPHANWDNPPTAPYADWLITVFDRWYADPPQTRVRLFEDVISLVLGGPARGEQVGLTPSGVLVIESDGAIEQVDALKSAYEGACATGLNVRHDELDAVFDDPGIVARQIGRLALADECLACPIVAACGGGHYAHRYRSGAGFRQPSAYCADLAAFIAHVQRRVTADLPRHDHQLANPRQAVPNAQPDSR